MTWWAGALNSGYLVRRYCAMTRGGAYGLPRFFFLLGECFTHAPSDVTKLSRNCEVALVANGCIIKVSAFQSR